VEEKKAFFDAKKLQPLKENIKSEQRLLRITTFESMGPHYISLGKVKLP